MNFPSRETSRLGRNKKGDCVLRQENLISTTERGKFACQLNTTAKRRFVEEIANYAGIVSNVLFVRIERAENLTANWM